MQHRHLTGLVVVLVLVLAAFTGTALAGGDHGNGGGNGNGGGHDQQAQSQSAQSQQTAPSTQQPAAPTKDKGKGSSDKQSSTSATNPATGGDNSHGVKPSNTTKHDTYAKASSDQTKQYGNGKTAGQIATQSGHGDATLHGPGNSQPHKTAPCPGGHEVDVHALKHKGSKCGSTESTKQSAPATHESKHEAKVEAKVEAKHEEHSTAKVEEHASNGVAASAHTHVTICHATGSSSHPFVMISPSASGVFHGHMGHQDSRDIIPSFTFNGQTYSQNWTAAGIATYNAGCAVAQAAATQAATQTQTVTTQVVTTSATANTTQSAASTQVTQSSTQASQSSTQSTQGVAGTQATQTHSSAATPVAAGGVQGATAALKPKAKPAGGVLGTTTRLGGTVGSTNLPFTGLPLWIFAALAAALILSGLAMRRSARSRV